MDDDIREGFLCPICLKDLKSPTNLATHFEEFHSEDKDVLQQLRTVFGKAKRKFLKESPADIDLYSHNEQSDFVSHGTPATGGIDVALWETQNIGQTTSHSTFFRQNRKETIERCVVETNKLLIRLDKLIKSGVYATDSTLPNAIKTRKNVEKTVVPWEDDSSTKFCPNCSKKFNLTFRRHHCRLCGKVTCEICIGALDMELACDILKLDSTTRQMYVKLKRNDKDDSGLKACDPCHLLLLRQNKLMQDKHANSILLQFYERIHVAMREADSIQPKFLKMADSVNAGESDYNLEAAMETRVRLLKCYETVEALSKHIQNLGLDKEKQPHPQILKLQRSIRNYASNYLVDNMFTLPALPTKDQYAVILLEKAKERERRKTLKAQQLSAAKSKNAINNTSAAQTSTQTHQIDGKPKDLPNSQTANTDHRPPTGNQFRTKWSRDSHPVFQAVSISKKKDTSWGPVQVSTEISSDPLIQQIENVKGYIEQAMKERKYDEVEMFRQNLRELEMIYLDERRKGQESF